MSLLVFALSLILGNRADTAVLLNKEKKCIIGGFFDIKGKDLVKGILNRDELDAGDELLIRREISANGKSRAFVNDSPVNLDQLRTVTSLLVDLHQQFDTLDLADSGFQREVIDALGGNGELLRAYQLAFKLWSESK